MTTDTQAEGGGRRRGEGFTVGGMAKGSGMIHPNLATMLAVVTTDYPLEPGEAIGFLRPAVDASFNSISVDGECSTNDTVLLLANGASGIERTPASDEQFALCLREVCGDLAQQIVADGEGATVLAEIAVSGAASAAEARAIARADRHLAARQDRAVRPRCELGPDRLRRRLREVRRRLRAARPRPALDHDRRSRRCSSSRPADRRRARALERQLHDRGRPRARRRRRHVPDDRPLVRLRPDQRGVPVVSPSSSRWAAPSPPGSPTRSRGSARSATRSASCTAPGRRSATRCSAAAWRCASSPGGGVTTPEALEVVRESARRRQRRGSARRSAASRSRSPGTRSACSRSRCPSSASSALPLPSTPRADRPARSATGSSRS